MKRIIIQSVCVHIIYIYGKAINELKEEKRKKKKKLIKMLVTMETNPEPNNRVPSIMESLTLARVERARNRLESQSMDNNENQSLERRMFDSKVSVCVVYISKGNI